MKAAFSFLELKVFFSQRQWTFTGKQVKLLYLYFFCGTDSLFWALAWKEEDVIVNVKPINISVHKGYMQEEE